jgi:carbonic anhydrase
MKSVEITYRYAGDDESPRERPVDADAARRRMEEGNRAFADLFATLDAKRGTARRIIRIDRRDLGMLPDGAGSLRQRPYAAVLGCADARVPIELVFNEGPNDLFVVRVAGNTLGDDVRGSLSYAIEHLGESLKLIVVLGHSGCGAVTAAVDVFLEPAGYLALASQHSIRSLVDRLQIVVQACAKKMHAVFGPDIARHPDYRDTLIEVAVVTNAALAAHTLQGEIGVGAADGVRTAYGVYLLTERTIWAPRGGSDEVTGLAEPPVDAQGFVAFSEAVLRSQRIVGMLGR